MSLTQWWHDLRTKLEGQPDAVLTVALMIAAGVLIWVALQPDPRIKALLLAWVVAP